MGLISPRVLETLMRELGLKVAILIEIQDKRKKRSRVEEKTRASNRFLS